MSLAPSDVIQLIGILASLITSVIAIIISVLTLKQNSKMIDETSRPYVAIYAKTTNFQSPQYYLVIKNFGQTGATISSIKCSPDISLHSLFEVITFHFPILQKHILLPANHLYAMLRQGNSVHRKRYFISI